MDLRSIRVDDLGLTVRAYNCLATAGIRTVHELVHRTSTDLLRLPNMGRTSVRDVERALGKWGLWLSMRPSDVTALQNAGGGSTSERRDERGEAAEKVRPVSDVMSMGVHDLDLTVRAHNCLSAGNIAKVGDLVAKTPKELLQIQNMGKTTLRDIERTLGDLGLQLRGRSVDNKVMSSLDQDLSAEEIDAFVHALERIKRCGFAGVADLVRRSRKELAAIPGMDAKSLDLVEDRLRKWGIEFGATMSGQSAELDAESQVAAEAAAQDKGGFFHAETARDELIYAVERILSQAKPQWWHGFVAFHGIAGERLTLQQLAESGAKYGFGRPVTRERIRQILVRAERKVRKGVGRLPIQFGHWETAVAKARGCLPMSTQSLLVHFGYDAVASPKHTYKGLSVCAELLGLDFPFKEKTLTGVGSLVIDRDDVGIMRKIAHFKEVARGPYSEVVEVARMLDCTPDLLCRVIAASSGWEFLDDARQYFWKQPKLPPKNYSITGNAILSSLCKVFSVTHCAATEDLVQSVARDRMVRKSERIRNVPTQVLEGIAERSGLFELLSGQIVRSTDFQWCAVGERDIALLKICMKHGRTVASNVLYSGLVQGGMTAENAMVTIAYTPLLVHTRSGHGHKEGVYKFVPRPEDVDLDALARTVGLGSVGGADESVDAAGLLLRIPISSRTRLSGRYVDSEPIAWDGGWEVHDSDGHNFGSISISGRIVDGLLPVIKALDLRKDDILELRSARAGRILIAGP